MADFLFDYYAWIKAFHLIAVIAWMAGMLYLPRLFVYHAQNLDNAEQHQTFKVMEQKLLRIIMNPAMAAVWILGLVLLWLRPDLMTSGGWMHLKLTCVVLLSGLHGYFAKTRKDFALKRNIRSPSFYRWMNEAPTVLMVIIVIMAIVRPF